MHSIELSQFKDDDEAIITTAATEPEAVSVSVRTTGEIVDVFVVADKLRKVGVEGFKELFIACAQAAFAHRYDPLLSTE